MWQKKIENKTKWAQWKDNIYKNDHGFFIFPTERTCIRGGKVPFLEVINGHGFIEISNPTKTLDLGRGSIFPSGFERKRVMGIDWIRENKILQENIPLGSLFLTLLSDSPSTRKTPWRMEKSSTSKVISWSIRFLLKVEARPFLPPTISTISLITLLFWFEMEYILGKINMRGSLPTHLSSQKLIRDHFQPTYPPKI